METLRIVEDGILVIFRISLTMVLQDCAFLFFFGSLVLGGAIL